MTRVRVSALALALAFAGLLAGCTTEPPLGPPPRSGPTPTPPPALKVGDAAKRLPEGGIEYHLVVLSETGTVFVPVELLPDPANGGEGRGTWVRTTKATWGHDAEADRYRVMPAAEGGAALDEFFDVVFPASPQQLAVTVRYPGAAPAHETLLLRYRALAIPALKTQVYVPAAITNAKSSLDARDDRTPLGDRLRGVEVFRWLAGGFFLRDPGPLLEAKLTVPGISSDLPVPEGAPR